MQSTRNKIPSTQAARKTRRAAPTVPYLILLQAGFTMQHALRQSPVVSYTTFSPLPPDKLVAVYFLWHFPSLVLKHEVSQHYARTPYPMESGLSSPLHQAIEGKPSNQIKQGDRSPPPVKLKIIQK